MVRGSTMEQATSPGRLPPHAIEAEETLLSGCFIDPADSIAKALDAKVCEDSFYVPANRLIWKTVLWAYRRGIPIEVGAISEELKKLGKLDAVGGYQGLIKASSSSPTTAGLANAIQTVQERYMLRDLIKRGTKIVEDAHSYSGDIACFVESIEEALSLREGLEKQKTWAQACDESIERLKRISEGKQTDEDVGMEWPWKDATRFLGPVQKGELIVVAARPGRGKSSVARQLAAFWAEKYGPVDLFSREMPIGQLPVLFAQTVCGHSWREARYGRLHPHEVSQFTEALRSVKAIKNLRIHDRDKTFTQVFARIRAQVQLSKPKAIIIDYLQIYDVEQQKGETRDMAIGRITKALKDIAIDLSIPVILLAQISRSVEKEEREPRLSDIRESGNVEQDSDRVVFVHWPQKDSDGQFIDFNDHSVTTIGAKLLQAKGRGEGQGTCDLVFKRPIASFFSTTK